MRNKFDEQLEVLNARLTHMGTLCETAISAAIRILLDDGTDTIDMVLETEEEINHIEREIEALCMRLLLQQQPVARDLRTISSALKVITDMERIGDQALDIAEITRHIPRGTAMNKTHIKDMSLSVIQMVTASIDAFTRRDTEIARLVIRQDDNVDALFVMVRRELVQNIPAASESDSECLLDLAMITKYLERIGDHATNIAEWAIFSVTGERPGAQ